MLELEQRAHDALTAPRQRRFAWLVQNRDHIAQIIAELGCWGLWDLPALDRQLQLTEEAISGLIEDPRLAVELNAEYAVRDASLIHTRGVSPTGFDCVVCRTGRYGIDEILARLPEPIE